MEFKLVALNILICQTTLLLASDIYKNQSLFNPASEEDYTDYADVEEFEDKFRQNDKELDFSNIDSNPEQDNTSQPTTYAVTEEIDDIPNNTTIKGPIVTNFTIAVPLNTVTVNNLNITDAGENKTDDNDSTKASSRKNYISILHIKAEYGNDKPDITVVQDNSPFLHFNGFREYIKGIRQGIVNGLQSFLNNDKVPNTNDGSSSTESAPNVHNVVNAPVVFWNKLHSKSSDVVRKVHEGLFGRHFGH